MLNISWEEFTFTPIYRMPVSEIGFSARTHRALDNIILRSGPLGAIIGKVRDAKLKSIDRIKALGDLIQETEKSLMLRPGMAKGGIREIKEVLADLGKTAGVPLELGTKVAEPRNTLTVIILNHDQISNETEQLLFYGLRDTFRATSREIDAHIPYQDGVVPERVAHKLAKSLYEIHRPKGPK